VEGFEPTILGSEVASFLFAQIDWVSLYYSLIVLVAFMVLV